MKPAWFLLVVSPLNRWAGSTKTPVERNLLQLPSNRSTPRVNLIIVLLSHQRSTAAVMEGFPRRHWDQWDILVPLWSQETLGPVRHPSPTLAGTVLLVGDSLMLVSQFNTFEMPG